MDKITIPKLKGKENWTIWKLQIESNLAYHDFEGVLTGEIAEPNALAADATQQQRKDYEASLKKYKKANGYAITLLTTTVNESEPLSLIQMLKSARDMWQKLSLAYEQQSEQRLEHLYLQLLEYKKDPNATVAMHISKLQKLWLELNEESMRIDRTGLPLTLLLMRILSTLPEEYFEFRTTWESVPRDQRTVEYLLERLTMVEMRVSQRQEKQSTSALVAEGHAKSSKHGNQNVDKKVGNKQNGKKDYSNIRCYECNEIGHTKWKCPKLKNNNKSSNTSADTKKKGGSALFGVALISDSVDCGEWIADSGATHHMAKSSEFYSSYTAFREPRPVVTGNQQVMLAYGSGDIDFEAQVDSVWSRHYMQDVWYTPEVVKNLFSVPATTEKGFEYWMGSKQCKITRGGETFVIGERHQGLYKLNIRVILPDVPAQVCIASKTETLQVWHERFGHQSKLYVEKYLKKHNISYIKDNHFCEGCVLGKQHRLSFGTRTIAAEKPGDLIHADTCGPMEEESFSGYRYYVCFKDDFSKYRHVYYMKHKSEASEKLKHFITEAKVQGHTVKQLLTDGGGEFDNQEVRQLAQQFGFSHRLTMPYTPEQNGAAERENRILVEAARSMLHSTTLPKKLWAEAVNTAAYVINRTGPTKSEVSPYELWFGRAPSIDHFRIFGTECFSHIPKQKRKKFDAKSEKGYVVGYCGDKDGYRVYVPERHTVIMSRDVVFKEEVTSSVEETVVKTMDDTATEHAEHDLEMSFADEGQVEDNTPSAEMRILRDRDQLRLPGRYDDYAMFAVDSYATAMQSVNRDEWKNAMDDELKSLADNNT